MVSGTDWVARLTELRRELAGDPAAPVAVTGVTLRERFPLGGLAPLDAGHPWRRTRADWSGAAYPSVMGATLGVGDMVPGLVARARWLARDADGAVVVRGGEKKLPVTAGLIGPWVVDPAQPGIALVAHVHWHESDWIATVLLVNRHEDVGDAAWIAGPRLELASVDGDVAFVRRPHAIVPGETSWASYDYDPDGVPVRAVAPRVAWGHAATVELEPPDAVSPARARVELVPVCPQADPAPAPADGPELGAWVSGPAEAIAAQLAEAGPRYSRWLASERAGARDAAAPTSPHLAADELSAERERIVLARVRAGVVRLTADPLALWALRTAAWVVMDRTGQARWREDQLAFLLAAAPWALGVEAGESLAAARLVHRAPGAGYAAFLGLAALERAWSTR